MSTQELEAILTPIINFSAPLILIVLLVVSVKRGIFKDAKWGDMFNILDIIPEKKLFNADEIARPEYQDQQSNPNIVGTNAFYVKKHRENE